MTSYSLINLLSTACAPDAPFIQGATLWWVPDARRPKGGYLVLSTSRPTHDAVNVSDNDNGPMRVGL